MTWVIFREIADPLVAEGLGRLSWPTLEADAGEGAERSRCAALDPVREGCAPVWVEPVGTSWINLAVGDTFPGGAVYELVIEEGWPDELRACLQAVVDGRYRDRVSTGRVGELWEMIFELPGEERVVSRRDLTGRGYDTKPGEHTYAPYRA
jgi:hypothetical protein